MKELYIVAHEAEIAAYLEANPDATEDEAYDRTADAAYLRMQDMIAHQIDASRDRMKYGE